MKVLRIIKSVNPGGGGPIEGLLQQARQLADDGIVTEVVSLDDPAAPFVKTFPLTLYPLGRQVDRSGWRRFDPLRHYGYEPRLVPWLRAHQDDYDVAVVEGLWNYSVMGARWALVGSRLPYVVFSHGMLDPWFNKTYPVKTAFKQAMWFACEGPLLSGAHAVLFTTEEEQLLARQSFRPYKVREKVVGFGTADVPGNAAAQIAAFRAAMPSLGDRPYLLYLSRIHPKKGCDLLIDAFAAIAKDHPDLDLVIAGPDRVGWQADLEAQSARVGMSARIHWPGMLMGDVKWGAFRDAEAFVLPSHQENFGVVVAEGMAAGKPVLITDKVNIWREVDASGGGLVETDDVPGITRLLRRFLELSPAQKAEMGQRGRQAFLDRFEIGRAGIAIKAALMDAASASRRTNRPS